MLLPGNGESKGEPDQDEDMVRQLFGDSPSDRGDELRQHGDLPGVPNSGQPAAPEVQQDHELHEKQEVPHEPNQEVPCDPEPDASAGDGNQEVPHDPEPDASAGGENGEVSNEPNQEVPHVPEQDVSAGSEPAPNAGKRKVTLNDMTPNSKAKEIERRKQAKRDNSNLWHKKCFSRGSKDYNLST